MPAGSSFGFGVHSVDCIQGASERHAVVLGHELPVGLPSGTELLFQMWIGASAGPKSFAASNAVRGSVP